MKQYSFLIKASMDVNKGHLAMQPNATQTAKNLIELANTEVLKICICICIIEVNSPFDI